ncbi:MAG TPA: carboxypeptidase-like regulatory domain-containing protein [Chitinophagaceae bacterium]|nr:carboxypeptidase-like regulatory domain-containing protein [Chitinophagaceae bacterium]
MPENKTIKNYSAADIEKYWSSKLTAAEMHEMEKAAMDDPFLADALEGYKYSANADEELRILQEKFNKKVDTTVPVIPIHRKKYAWLKIAAAIIVLVGAGIVVQQLATKNKAFTPIADVEKAEESKPDANTGTNEAVPNNLPGTTGTDTAAVKTRTTKKENTQIATDLNSSFALVTIDSLKSDYQNENSYKKSDANLQKNDVVVLNEAEKREALNEKAQVPRAVADSARPGFKEKAKANAAMKTKAMVEGAAQARVLNNSFSYRVVDAQNKPVPFANVTNTRDNIGTYTDIRGYFNLVSGDSVLDVQVRSLGFNSENYRLVPSRQPNNLILTEDATARNQMQYDPVGRVLSHASRKDSAEVEEPEVGWGYYNTYVENNIKIPENVRAKNALNDVELSFDVDKSGQPVNIKVTKSSQCKECDEEAKRLLKEGPKWKRKGRKFKTTISIAVDQK